MDTQEFTTEELLELRDMCLDSAWYWKSKGNEYAEKVSHEMQHKVHEIITARGGK
jgi:hypothetical protein